MKNKATKKQFEGESEDNKGLNQDEIDRNSTLKKVEFKEAISQREAVEPKQGVEVYKNYSKEIEKNGKFLNNNKLEPNVQIGEEENAKNGRLNFDGKKSTEGKTFNYSVLSRSKSGDAKVQSSSKNDKESINTAAGENLYYGRSKDAHASKQVVIEEIEIPLEEQNEVKKKDNHKTEKSVHPKLEKKTMIESKSNELKEKKRKSKEEKMSQKNSPIGKDEYFTSIKSQRGVIKEEIVHEDMGEKKRKQSDFDY